MRYQAVAAIHGESNQIKPTEAKTTGSRTVMVTSQ